MTAASPAHHATTTMPSMSTAASVSDASSRSRAAVHTQVRVARPVLRNRLDPATTRAWVREGEACWWWWCAVEVRWRLAMVAGGLSGGGGGGGARTRAEEAGPRRWGRPATEIGGRRRGSQVGSQSCAPGREHCRAVAGESCDECRWRATESEASGSIPRTAADEQAESEPAVPPLPLSRGSAATSARRGTPLPSQHSARCRSLRSTRHLSGPSTIRSSSCESAGPSLSERALRPRAKRQLCRAPARRERRGKYKVQAGKGERRETGRETERARELNEPPPGTGTRKRASSCASASACGRGQRCSSARARQGEETDEDALLLADDVLGPRLDAVRLLERADEDRVPAARARQHRLDALDEREKERRTHQSSLAMPRSLQHRMRALLLQPSLAVGTPLGSKNVCSPRATDTSLQGPRAASARALRGGERARRGRTVRQRRVPTRASPCS